MHDSSAFAIGLSGLDLSSADAFAYSLGRGLASAAASAGMGMLASEAGLGGFVSTIAASLAGAYVNTELLPQSTPTRTEEQQSKLPNISETSTISFEHDGKEFRAVNVDFNKEEFAKLIKDLKAEIYNEALDQNLSSSETIERIEVLGEWAEETIIKAKKEGKSDDEAVEEVKKDVDVAKEIVKIDQEVKKEPTDHAVLSTETKSNINPDVVELIYSRLTQNNSFETSHEKAMRTYLFIKMLEVSAQPTPENLSNLEKTIKVCKKVAVGLLDEISSLIAPQTAEATPLAIPAIDLALVRMAMWMSENPQFIPNAISTISGVWSLGQILERSKAKSSSTSAPARGSMTSGGGSVLPPDPDHDPKKKRKVDTKSDQENRWNAMKESGEWERYDGPYSKPTLRNKRTGDLAQKSIEKWEIEVFKKNGQHKGVIRPSEGVIRTEFAKPGRTIK